jgi:hypothetical protein
MRPSLLASSIAILCLFAVSEVRAQSCIPVISFPGMSIEGPKCSSGVYATRCGPGSTVTFEVTVRGNGPFPPPATCPTQITWNFGDGVTTVTNTEARSITHVYPALGVYLGKVTVQVQGAPQLHTFELHSADGYFDTDRSTTPELAEGATANVTVTRTGDLSQAASVGYRTPNYTLLVPVSGTLVFAPGETSKTIAVQAADDTVWNGELRRSAYLELHDSGTYLFKGAYYGNGSDVVITSFFEIIDNDEPTRHRCTQTSLSVSETAGFANIEMERTGNLANHTLGSVDLSETHLPIPYPHIVYLAEFSPGQSHATVKLPLTNDSVYLGTQTEALDCGGGGPGTKETSSSVKLTITDDEPFPTLIAPASAEIDETDSDQVLEIPISFVPNFGRPPDIQVSLLHMTTDEEDAEVLHPYLIPPISVLIHGDKLPEADERMVVRIAGEVSASIPVIIRDDDRPPFPYLFDRDSYVAEEEYASVTVERSGDRSAAANLILHVRAATPVQWDDAIPVTFAPGEASKVVVIPVQDDWYTGQRTATLELDLDGFVGATAILTVNDDETVPSLSVADAAVREGGLEQKTLLEVPITLSAPAGYDVKVAVAMSHVTTDAADLVNTASQKVTIYTGKLAAKAVFEIVGDIDYEGDETFAVAITSCCGGLATVARGTATATILNDDGVPVANVYRLVLGATQFHESQKWLTVTVKRFGRVQGAALATLRLTAAPRHFEPRQVYFLPNETEKEVGFYVEDSSYTGTVDGRLELFEGERLLVSAPVMILDDEHQPAVSVNGFHAREGSAEGTARIRVFVQPLARETFTVHLMTFSDSAKLSDYEPLDAVVEIPAGTAWRDIPITLLNDSIREGQEEFYVDIISVNGVAVSRSPSNHSTACFIDDDDGGYLRYEEVVPAETTTTITIELPPGAVTETMIVFPSAPGILEMPGRVAVTAGARSVSFEAKAHAAGAASFSVFLPAYLDFTRLNATIWVVGPPRALTLSPAALQLEPGTSARVDVTASPGLSAWTDLGQQSRDLAVAAVDANPGVPGEARFLTVYAVAPGRTEITLTLYDGASVTLPVIVADPVSRRQGVHH